jgi:hypothetical protein
MRTTCTVLAVAAVVGIVSRAAWADVIISTSPGGGNPPENLLFNQSGLALGPATTVQGATNQTQHVLDITSNVNLVGNGGQARVNAQNPTFGSGGVSFIPHSANNLPSGLVPLAGFTDIKFNPDVTANGNMEIEVFVNDEKSPLVDQLFPVDKNGQNFFRIQSNAGDVITKITLVTPTNTISDIAQIRLGGLVDPGSTTGGTTGGGTTGGGGGTTGGNATPEPGSVLLWTAFGLGLAGFAARRRRQNGATTLAR